MNARQRLVVLPAVVVLSLVAGAAWPKETKPKPDATLTIEARQVALGVGWSWGKGDLQYKGKRYPFKVDGLSVAAVGIERGEATGEVRHLTKLEDFDGTYTAVEASGAAGGGGGIATMRNANGVTITLHSTTRGFAAQIGPEGVRMTLEK